MSEIEKVIEKMVQDKKLYVDEFVQAFKKENNDSEDGQQKDLFDKIKNVDDKESRDQLVDQLKNEIGNLDIIKDKISDTLGGLFKQEKNLYKFQICPKSQFLGLLFGEVLSYSLFIYFLLYTKSNHLLNLLLFYKFLVF